MATAMASRQPPLPARQRSEPNAAHTPFSQPQRSDHFKQTVPYHSHTHNAGTNVTHVKLGQEGPRGIETRKEPPGGRRMSEPAAPPLPRRNHENANQPIRKRSIETNSFIQRNTARVFSDPQQASMAPPTPERLQTRTLPRTHTTANHDNDAPPPLPESRPPRGPPKGVVQQSAGPPNPAIHQGKGPPKPAVHQGQRPPKPAIHQDFESRFRFHGPSDFPEPDLVATIRNKAYPSASIKRPHQHSKNHEATLDPL